MVRLVILGLLSKKTMHGYEIQQNIEKSGMEQWTNILKGSIYYSLKKMEEEGLIVAQGEERVGNQIRKIYAISPSGKDELLSLLGKALVQVPHEHTSEFNVSLYWFNLLPKEEIVSCLKSNLEELKEQHISEISCVNGNVDMHPVFNAAVRNAMKIMQADIEYLEELISYFSSNEVTNLPF